MYSLSEQDLDIQARARAFADELIPLEAEAELAGGELPAEVESAHKKRAIELGLYAANLPKQVGGGGCTSLQQVLIQEQVGRVTNALAWVVATPPSWLPEVATQYQLERYVRPAARGERDECYAITEEGAGSDVSAIEATARRDGGSYVLNGVKWHVTSFNAASYAFFQAKLAGGEHAGEHAMFLVDLPSPGVEIVRTPAYMHTLGHAHQHPIVAFSDVRVPAANLVGAEGDGMSFAYEWFRFERLMVAARCLGAAQRLVAEMTGFASERVVRGRPIASFGAVQAMLADSLTELFAARSLTYETARGADTGVDVKIQHAQCSMAKLYAAEMANRVADRAVQVFGGRGYMREYAAERFYRELRVERIWEGTSEVQRSIIADQMIKRGPDRLA
ncbi:MAG TPA: acyl-CoA dehydrogenase family protein [Streptosporangiaceae bacterium]|nr:acyl-CoA dehydrogenase family protein [Streptosporangiaceae bacterium]